MKMFIKASTSEGRDVIPTDNTVKNKLISLNNEVKQRMDTLEHHTKDIK